MSAFVPIEIGVVLTIHEELLVAHGGGKGVRDIGLLEVALARPQNRAAYDPEADAATIAAAYAFGIARNHPFIDGNKRTAYVLMELSLVMNGLSLTATDEDAISTMLELAAGALGEDALATWIRGHLSVRGT